MTNDERDDLLIELKLKIVNLKDDVDQIKHVLLEGNGKPPLTEQVLTTALHVARLIEERADKKMPRAFWVGLVIPSIISIVAIVVTVF